MTEYFQDLFIAVYDVLVYSANFKSASVKCMPYKSTEVIKELSVIPDFKELTVELRR